MGGRIVTAQSLDREDVSFYQLVLVAGDGGSPRLFSSVPLTVAILDVNDNSPVFNRSNWMLNLLENTNNTFVMEFTVRKTYYINKCLLFTGRVVGCKVNQISLITGVVSFQG